MDKIVHLAPYLKPPPDRTLPNTIAVLMTGNLCLSFPPPPWSTAEDTLETSGLLQRHPGDDLLNVTFTPEDPQPDGYSEFRFANRRDADDIWRPTYSEWFDKFDFDDEAA